MCSALLIPSILIGQKTNYITQLQNKLFGDPREYNWSLTVGSKLSGSLTNPGNNTLTFTNCPYGVMGNAENMWVRVYSGIGTEEPAKIIGGTCLGTGLSGTLIITTANSHTGSWKIGAANSGVREAMNTTATKRVVLNPGEYTWYGPLAMQESSSLECGYAGSDYFKPTCKITFIPNNMTAVMGYKSDFVLQGIMFVRTTPVAVVGSNGFESKNGESGGTAGGFKLKDVSFGGFYNGVIVSNTSLSVLENVLSHNNENDCFLHKKGQGYWTNITAVGCKGDGLEVAETPIAGGVPALITTYHSFAHGGWGIRYSASSGNTYIQGCYINNESLGGILVEAASIASDNHMISNCIIEWSGDNSFAPAAGYPKVNNAPAIKLEFGAGPMTFSNISIYGPNGNALDIASGYNTFDNVRVFGPGQGAVADNTYALKLTGGANRFTNFVGAPIKMISGQNNSFTQITSEYSSNTIPTFEVVAGTSLLLDRMSLYQAGTANALKIASGVTLIDGQNAIFGTISNLGTKSDQNFSIFPFAFVPITFAQMTGLTNTVAGQAYICVGCAVNTTPCIAGGSSVLAVKFAAGWSCGNIAGTTLEAPLPAQQAVPGIITEPRKLVKPADRTKLRKQ